MVFKLEGKEETTVRNVLNLTLILQVKFSLHTYEFSRRLTYLKDAILKADKLKHWQDWKAFVPQTPETSAINRVLVLPDQHCATLIQMSLWRQVKIKLDEHKSVEGGFRYEEAIPPDTLMYFSWGTTSQANGTAKQSYTDFQKLLVENKILQVGGQESLGRGFVQQCTVDVGE